ncbi:MAG TPA: dihydrodipicolinate synthase family protein [Bryobacteraceae bacterium]|nr:dihydrodipicolinate synthase family protein [Bryobacteraceae bacterium]
MTQKSLSGVLSALVTPLNGEGEIDEAAIARLVQHIRAGGVKGVCPVGSTGEGPHLSAAQRLQVVKAVRREAGSDLPVIPGVAATAFEDARRQVDDYAKAGADAVLVTPPFYYLLPQSAVRDFFLSLADASPLPVLLYNIPHLTKVAIAPETVAELARHAKIAGMKDSSRDFEYFQNIAAFGLPEFSLLTGSDTMLLASLLAGGHGTIAASTNLAPWLSVSLMDAVRAGDLETARRLQFRLLHIVQLCRRGSFPAGWKAALELAGLCSARTVPPTPPLSRELTQQLFGDLKQSGLELAAAS